MLATAGKCAIAALKQAAIISGFTTGAEPSTSNSTESGYMSLFDAV